MSEDDGKITTLPVRFKSPLSSDRTLLLPFEVPQPGKCDHLFTQYIIDPAAAEVECGKCHEKLNPMWVLERLASEDRRIEDSRKRYREESQRLSDRLKTKCQHCGKMTRISRT